MWAMWAMKDRPSLPRRSGRHNKAGVGRGDDGAYMLRHHAATKQAGEW
eukprot:CAMPEP_0202894198 /NCGR_PEP_ID=MMETSP1392-20130828/3641_1 /ASSEMBLY_ACC=CAM_ASM_000868 /TAXON_ID=225041 /ORGANISM="Chlamydomonas chlamydogama, Strain SAG 11-48b" /LENGTH=47 /DNA_ID= /DNA_START= /DNA_END= /DNA_ORIENTATION=